MLRLSFEQFEIILDYDEEYTFGSADNLRVYDRSYRLDDEPYRASSQHSVSVNRADDAKPVSSCILAACGGASSIHEHSAVINADQLIIAVGPFAAALQLPSLELLWKTRADNATCFGVYHSAAHHCYISHGECAVSRLSYSGHIDWSHWGADTFWNGFTVHEDRVEAIDWNNDVYVWDIQTGEPVDTSPNKAFGPND